MTPVDVLRGDSPVVMGVPHASTDRHVDRLNSGAAMRIHRRDIPSALESLAPSLSETHENTLGANHG